MTVHERPIGLALLVCDTIIEDRLTGKRSLIGLFNRLTARQFPCTHGQLSIFVSLTSGRGAYPCAIRCRHRESGTLAFCTAGQVQCRDPLQVVELCFTINGARFPEPGDYWLEFEVDEVPLMMRQLTLVAVPDPA